MLGVLLKRQFQESLYVFRRNRKRFDVAGLIITLALAAVALYAFITVFSMFVDKYCYVRLNGITDVAARRFEIMTLVYEALFVVGLFGAVKSINAVLFNTEEQQIMITLPVRPSTVFFAKMFRIYVMQAAFMLCLLIPVNSVFGVITGQSGYYAAMTVVTALIYPFTYVSAAAILCVPVHYIMDYLKRRYVLYLLAATALYGLIFWGYAELLGLLQGMMTSGDIKFVFSENFINGVGTAVEYFYPANLAAGLVLGDRVLECAGLLAVFVVVGGAIGLGLVNLLYSNAAKLRFAGGRKRSRAPIKLSKQAPIAVSLLKKEFETVLRTPDYAVQYLSVAALTPMMTVLCMGIGGKLLESLLFIERDFEVALFLTVMFGALANTFCATNISREGKAFFFMKTIPLGCRQILSAKIVFNLIVSFLSVALCAGALAGFGYLTPAEAALLFFVGAVTGAAQIMFATRLDLNRPSFAYSNPVDKSTASTVSVIILTGLFAAGVLGGVPLYVSVLWGLKGLDASTLSYLFPALLALALFGASLAFLIVGVRRRFYRMTEGD